MPPFGLFPPLFQWGPFNFLQNFPLFLQKPPPIVCPSTRTVFPRGELSRVTLDKSPDFRNLAVPKCCGEKNKFSFSLSPSFSLRSFVQFLSPSFTASPSLSFFLFSFTDEKPLDTFSLLDTKRENVIREIACRARISIENSIEERTAKKEKEKLVARQNHSPLVIRIECIDDGSVCAIKRLEGPVSAEERQASCYQRSRLVPQPQKEHEAKIKN